MRTKTTYRKISVTKEIHEMLKNDRDKYQQEIGGGIWSISDVIKKYKETNK